MVLGMVRDIYSISYKMRRELHAKIASAVLFFLLCIFIIGLVRGLLVYPVLEKSTSMSPGVMEKSAVLVAPLIKKVRRGQIILVKAEENEKHSFLSCAIDFACRLFTAQQISSFPAESEASPVLRRVVGIPGDTVYISNYLVYIKPAGQQRFLTEFELTRTKYSLSVPAQGAGIDSQIGAVGNMEPVTLADGEYFVLADNRIEAVDSRIWGPVNIKSFRGKALFAYFPPGKARFFW